MPGDLFPGILLYSAHVFSAWGPVKCAAGLPCYEDKRGDATLIAHTPGTSPSLHGIAFSHLNANTDTMWVFSLALVLLDFSVLSSVFYLILLYLLLLTSNSTEETLSVTWPISKSPVVLLSLVWTAHSDLSLISSKCIHPFFCLPHGQNLPMVLHYMFMWELMATRPDWIVPGCLVPLFRVLPAALGHCL